METIPTFPSCPPEGTIASGRGRSSGAPDYGCRPDDGAFPAPRRPRERPLVEGRVRHDADGVLLLHLGMSGRVTVGNAALPAAPHDHVVLTLDDDSVIRFNDPRRFGLIDYVKRGEAARHPLLVGLDGESGRGE